MSNKITDFKGVIPAVLSVFDQHEELDEHGITYDLRDVMKLEMPDVKLPWKE